MKRKLEVKRDKGGFHFEAKSEGDVPVTGEWFVPDEKLLGSFLDLANVEVTPEVLKELQDMKVGNTVVVDAECT